MREKGVALAEKGDLDGGIEWIDKALQANEIDFKAMRNRGIALSRKGDLDAAIRWYDQAITANPYDFNAMRDMSIALLKKADRDGALGKIADAAKGDPKAHEDAFRFVATWAGENADEAWTALFPEKEAPTQDVPKGFPELRALIVLIQEAYREETATFLRQKKEDEQSLKGFLKPESRLATDRSLLMVLRKWNSYTPAIPSSAEDERSRGGGYFLWHKGRGTVIDPGYNFIENFHLAGCRICDIDNVILTHAHNDHTIDFETLRTLLHEFNADLKGADSKRAKKVRFFLNNGAFVKLVGLMDLNDTNYTESVRTMNAGSVFDLKGGGQFRVLPAYHDEIVALDQAVGLFFTFSMGDGEDRRILFTSDTGLFPLKRDDSGEVKPDTKGKEIWEAYDLEKVRSPDLMVPHIGSVKETELVPTVDLDLDPGKACYPNHLGIIGTARLITKCRPRLAVVSEFGEEMRQFRCTLVHGLQEKVIDAFFEKDPEPYIPRVVPGDLPFVYDIGGRAFYCCVQADWVGADKIAFSPYEGKQGLQESVYYFDAGRKDQFENKPEYFVKAMENDRQGHEGMYFDPEAD